MVGFRHWFAFFVGAMFSIAKGSEPSLISIDFNQHYQVIGGFGASDAWNANFIGQFWSEDEKRKAAKWLFAKGKDSSGKPLGASLSIWRVNLGAGSASQGDASGISNATRRTESFLQPDGVSLNAEKAMGQQWFAQNAKNHGVEQFVAFSVSPHISHSMNGLARPNAGERYNLHKNHYQTYSRYLLQTMQIMTNRTGVKFDYLSPLNEPQYAWNTNKQEGCSFTNSEVSELCKVLDEEILSSGMDVKILIPEAADWQALTRVGESPDYSNQIVAFWDTGSPNYIGDLKSLAPSVAGHSYWLNRTEEEIETVRSEVAAIAGASHLDVQQTEYSMINLAQVEDNPPETAWDRSRFLARIMQSDLVYGNVSTWCFWTAFEQDIWGYGNCYHLIQIDAQDPEDLEKGGRLIADTNLWAMAHFSHFLRPGSTRIHLEGANDQAGLFASAYISHDRKALIAVILNENSTEEMFELRIQANENYWVQFPYAATLYSSIQSQQMLREDYGGLKLNHTFSVRPESINTLVIPLN